MIKKKNSNIFYINGIVYNESHPDWNEDYFNQLSRFNAKLYSRDKILNLIYDTGWEKKNSNNHYTFKRKIDEENIQHISCSSTPKHWENVFYDFRKREIEKIEKLINLSIT